MYCIKSRTALFLVITSTAVRLRELIQSVKTTMCYTKSPDKDILTGRLLHSAIVAGMWNHAISNCNAKPVCMKYAIIVLPTAQNQHSSKMSCVQYTYRIWRSHNREIVNRTMDTASLKSTLGNFSPSRRNSYLPNTRQQTVGPNPDAKETAADAINPARKISQAAHSIPSILSGASQEQVMENLNNSNCINQLNDPFAGFEQLNSIINVENMLMAVCSLNNMLQNCTTFLEWFEHSVNLQKT